jgi:hypothetical protein
MQLQTQGFDDLLPDVPLQIVPVQEAELGLEA